MRFVPAPSPEARRREARERDATVAARWIESLGVSLRRAGASGASALKTGTKADTKNRDRDRDPFADATRTNAAELAAVCADGTLLCELVRVLEKKELAGVVPSSDQSFGVKATDTCQLLQIFLLLNHFCSFRFYYDFFRTR